MAVRSRLEHKRPPIGRRPPTTSCAPRYLSPSRYGGSVPETRSDTSPVPLSDDVHYRLLKLLAERPEISQRGLAEALGVSLGKINYCVKALLDQGWVKATNFRNSHNKLAYAYLLTPSGIDAKSRITVRFLKRKIEEYEILKTEIASLQAEVAAVQTDATDIPDNKR